MISRPELRSSLHISGDSLPCSCRACSPYVSTYLRISLAVAFMKTPVRLTLRGMMLSSSGFILPNTQRGDS